MFEQYDNFDVREPFYSGWKLMGMKDLNKEKPEIFICTSNRSAGKTTFFNGYAVHDFLQNNNKFLLLFRNKYEAENAVESFFNDIEKIFFSGLMMIQQPIVKNVCYRLIIGESIDPDDENAKFEGVCCGYVCSLAAAEQVKRSSHLLSDCNKILFDEFQSENGKYLKNEISALMSIHDSVARGAGKQVKYLPLYLIGNLIDLYNPYYEELGISRRLDENCNFMRGNGWVLEQGFNEASAQAHKESAFHKAFSSAEYTVASQKKEYLKTDTQFINPNIENRGLYLGTILYKRNKYGVRYIESINVYYISEKPDKCSKTVFAATQNDISENAVYFKRHNFKDTLQSRLHAGLLLFDSKKSKDAGLSFIYGKD